MCTSTKNEKKIVLLYGQKEQLDLSQKVGVLQDIKEKMQIAGFSGEGTKKKTKAASFGPFHVKGGRTQACSSYLFFVPGEREGVASKPPKLYRAREVPLIRDSPGEVARKLRDLDFGAP